MPSIAFIFAYRKTDEWSTPLSIVREFASRGWHTPIYSLFDDNDNYVDDNIHTLLTSKPDIILHMDWGQHTSPILSKLRNTDAFCIMESGDDPQQFNRNVIKAPWFDLILSPDNNAVREYRKRGFNAEWWTHFADTRLHSPIEVQEEYIAVSSRGMGSSPILDTLATKYPEQIKNQNGWEGREHTIFLNSGHIVIQDSRYGEITRRIFEGMACKKMVLADQLHEDTLLHTLFTDGEDIVLYSNLQDCINKIAYYSKHAEERELIAANGYQKVLQSHTQSHRVDLIIDKWKSYQSQ